MTASFINVDYDRINELIKMRGTTRAKCADACGIKRSTLGNAFKRHSKMRADQVWKIADFLGVKPSSLLLKDEWGNPKNYNDWEAVTDPNGISDYDRAIDEGTANAFRAMYYDLNISGKDVLINMCQQISDLIHDIPAYLAETPDENIPTHITEKKGE